MELCLGIITVLPLTGHNHTRAILGDGLQILIGEEYDSGLENREQQRDKRRRNQSEFDGSRFLPVTAKSPGQVSSCGRNSTRRHEHPNRQEIQRDTISKMIAEMFSGCSAAKACD